MITENQRLVCLVEPRPAPKLNLWDEICSFFFSFCIFFVFIY